ncbi:MAG TPA: hypothetical protein VH988_12385 [Thermoanaerobaculia bacterium]|jgi:hypothetical protein|nr:hypothetical protein [Thermoanaerobaculia bacterium]
MKKLKLQSVSPALGPTAGMAPPGCCRGAVGSWPQLLRALARIVSPGGALNTFQAGSPSSLMRALAVYPAILQADQPPQDLYSHFVWFTIRLLSAAKTMAATLRELPGLAAGTAVGQTLAGTGGLKQTADAMAQRADDLMRRLGQSNALPGVDAALAGYKTAGASLGQRATGISAGTVRDLALLQAATAEGAQELRRDLDELELQAATVSAAAVLDNLEAVMRSWGDEWRAVSANLASVASTSTPEQLADDTYLRQTLDLDRAVQQWGALAGAVQAYVQRLLAPPATNALAAASP